MSKSYIVTYETSDGDLKERHVEARHHRAAADMVAAEGFTVVSVERDEDGSLEVRSHKRFLKRMFVSLLIGALLAGVCILVFWLRTARHG